MIRRAVTVLAALLVLTSAVGACSGEDATTTAIDLSAASLGEPAEYPIEEWTAIPANSSSAQWIELPDDEICVTSVVDDGNDNDGGNDIGATERRCTTWTSSFDRTSPSWSADQSTLYFTEDFYGFLEEPDIWAYEWTTGTLTNRADDAADEIRDDRALIDVSPFADDSGRLHFFTLDPDADAVDLTALDDDGTPRDIPSIDVELPPQGAVRPIGGNRFVYQAFSRERRGLVLLDLAAGTATEIEVPRLEEPWVLGTGAGALVATDLQAVIRFTPFTVEYVDVDVDVDRARLVDVGIDPDRPVPPTVGFAPDGSGFVAIVNQGEGMELLGFTTLDNGTLDGPHQVAEPGFLGLASDGDARLPRTQTGSSLVWTEDNQVVIPTLDAVLVFDLVADG